MIEHVIAKLREPVTEEELLRLATEVLAERPREAATELFAVLKEHPGEDLITNALSLFRELAGRSPAWGTLLRKSIHKRGRCPKPLVPMMRHLLSQGRGSFAAEVGSVRKLLGDLEIAVDEETALRQPTVQTHISGVQIKRTPGFFRSGRLRATAPITSDLTDIPHMEALASLLNDIPPTTEELQLDFSGVEHVYVVGLTALAAWCRKMGITPQIANASDGTLRYLDVIGFTKASKGGISPYTETDPTFAMGMQEIIADSKPESVASKLVTIIDAQAHLSSAMRQGLIVVFAELIENIHRHAGLSSVAFACAQVYPKRRKLTICVADTGIGIRQSILTSSNERLIQRMQAGESSVLLACLPLVTSKPDKHSGYGLYVASELVVRNGGTFRIFSGDEIYTRYQKNWQKRENLLRVQDPWNGTWVAMILDLDARIPVGDVYVTLPPMPGAELEEFF